MRIEIKALIYTMLACCLTALIMFAGRMLSRVVVISPDVIPYAFGVTVFIMVFSVTYFIILDRLKMLDGRNNEKDIINGM